MAAFEIFQNSKSSSSQYQLKNPPSDGISCLRFSNKVRSDALLVSSWDGTLKLYDTKLDSVRWKHTLDGNVPILCCDFAADDDSLGITGCLDGKIRTHSFGASGTKPSAGRAFPVGHDGGVSCIGWSSETNLACSGGWDKKLCTWDVRSTGGLSASTDLPGKAFSLSVSSENKVVVACSERNILIYDLRNLSKPQQVRQSSLQQQIRTIECSTPEIGAYAIGTVDGRVAIEYFDPENHIKKKFAFKCHRQKEDVQINNNVDRHPSKSSDVNKEKATVAYPVNAIAFHPTFGTFATGGGDGMVVTWDAINRKRITQYSKYPTSIAALSFNHDGSRLAIASSYTYEKGEMDDKPQDAVYVRVIKKDEVQPKSKKKI